MSAPEAFLLQQVLRVLLLLTFHVLVDLVISFFFRVSRVLLNVDRLSIGFLLFWLFGLFQSCPLMLPARTSTSDAECFSYVIHDVPVFLCESVIPDFLLQVAKDLISTLEFDFHVFLGLVAHFLLQLDELSILGCYLVLEFFCFSLHIAKLQSEIALDSAILRSLHPLAVDLESTLGTSWLLPSL